MANNFSKIRFIDIIELEAAARKQVTSDLEALNARSGKNGRLSESDKLELARLQGLSDYLGDGSLYFDPLFASARHGLKRPDSGLKTLTIDHNDLGQLKLSSQADAEVARIGLVLGLLRHRGAPLPRLIVRRDASAGTAKASFEVVPESDHVNKPLFDEELVQAVGRTSSRLSLAMKVLALLAETVDPKKLQQAAYDIGVAYVGGFAFHIGDTGHNTIRLNYSFAKEDDISEAIMRLGRALEEASQG